MSPESFRRIRPFCKLPRVIPFGPHGARELAARVSAGFQPVKNVLKVEQRPPSKLIAGSFVYIDPVDTGKHFPSTASILSLVFRNFPLQRQGCIGTQIDQIFRRERRSRTDNVTAEAD